MCKETLAWDVPETGTASSKSGSLALKSSSPSSSRAGLRGDPCMGRPRDEGCEQEKPFAPTRLHPFPHIIHCNDWRFTSVVETRTGVRIVGPIISQMPMLGDRVVMRVLHFLTQEFD